MLTMNFSQFVRARNLPGVNSTHGLRAVKDRLSGSHIAQGKVGSLAFRKPKLYADQTTGTYFNSTLNGRRLIIILISKSELGREPLSLSVAVNK